MRPSRSSHSDAAARAAGVGEPVQRAEVDELFAERHPRVESPLLWHVAELQALGASTPATPSHEQLTGVRFDEPEDGAHRRRLAGAVRAQEADYSTWPNLQTHIVEGHDLAEALRHLD